MKYIDEHYKDAHPNDTVEKIRNILRCIGIEPIEIWNNSGINNCWSLVVSTSKGFPSSNGKGVTRALARASAYGEFIERLQSGLFLYKYQSIMENSELQLHSFAPDSRYFSVEELIANGDWMDYLINEYGQGLTREIIAKQCQMYSCCSDKILTVPYYSLFENKYVYLPVGFAEQMYSANGCCVGNTKEEAWIHALSEILERKGEISLITSEASYPIVPEDVLYSFPIVARILDEIKKTNIFDVTVFDISGKYEFPILATRIINRKTHDYLVNTAADPIFEIAVHRTLTEIFQGRNINSFSSTHSSVILKSVSDVLTSHNVLNQLETGNGVFAYNFFLDDDRYTFSRETLSFDFANNKEILSYLLDKFRNLGVTVLVRNQSFLGFPCYKFIIPGFSETRALRLTESPQEYALGAASAKFLRSPISASDSDTLLYLSYYNKIKNIYSRRNHFGRMSGIPLTGHVNHFLIHIVTSYAFYRHKHYAKAILHINKSIQCDYVSITDIEYLRCLVKYLEFISQGFEKEIIIDLLKKFFDSEVVFRLANMLSDFKNPYNDFLPSCNYSNCNNCVYFNECAYSEMLSITKIIGNEYSKFSFGQDFSEFVF